MTRRLVIVSGLVLLLAACYGEGRSESALGATVFGAFKPPPGSVLVKASYTKGGLSGELIDCATDTRIFATNDPVGFRGAVYRTAQNAAWHVDQAEASVLPTEGMTEVFRGEKEIVELGFWTSRQRMSDELFAARNLALDWATYTAAAVLTIHDVAGSCSYDLAGRVTRVSGRVTDAATGQPIANVRVYTHFTATDAITATNKLAAACTAPWTRRVDGGCELLSLPARTAADGTFTFEEVSSVRVGLSPIRLSFDGGPGYKLAWWRAASNWADATDLVLVGVDRNIVITGIDMKMPKQDGP